MRFCQKSLVEDNLNERLFQDHASVAVLVLKNVFVC